MRELLKEARNLIAMYNAEKKDTDPELNLKEAMNIVLRNEFDTNFKRFNIIFDRKRFF